MKGGGGNFYKNNSKLKKIYLKFIIIVVLIISILLICWTYSHITVEHITENAVDIYENSNLEILEAVMIDNESIQIAVQRNSDESNLVGISFNLSDGENFAIVRENTTLQRKKNETFIFNLNKLNLSTVISVSIAPICIIETEDRKFVEAIGNIADSISVSIENEKKKSLSGMSENYDSGSSGNAIEIGPNGIPSNLTSTVISETEIQLNWTINSTNEDGISIERSTDGIVYSAIKNTTQDITSYSDAGLSSYTFYYYRVRAFRGTMYSEYSNLISGQTNYSVTLNIAGTGVNETNYILKLDVHKGINVTSIGNRDVFLNNKCRSNFSDIRFTDTNGNNLEYYLHSYGNYEFTKEGITTGKSIILANGDIISLGGAGNYNKVIKSTDGGITWTTIYTGTGTQELLFVDSRGYIFNIDSYLLKRTIDNGTTWTTVFDLTTGSATIQPMAFDEDASGNLYFGKYQDAVGAKIYKSTNWGENWTEAWNSPTDQHVHSLVVDSYTDYIYAGVDTTSKIIRSVNQGTNWTTIFSGPGGDVTSIYCGDGYRLFGNGESGGYAGFGIMKTINDINFTYPLMASQPMRAILEVDEILYAWGSSYQNNRYSQIYMSEDNGDSWKSIKILNYNSTYFYGYSQYQGKFGLPTTKAVKVSYGNEINNPAVLYNGGDHYQGLFYIKIPTLPADGTTINIVTDNSSISTSTQTIFSDHVKSSLIGRWKINEGTGISIMDYSGNGNNGTLTPGGSGTWNEYGLRRAGNIYPAVINSTSSYKFRGTDAVNAYITIPYNTTLDIVTNFSVVMWVSSDIVLNVNEYRVMLANIRYDTFKGWLLGVTGNSQVLQLSYGNGTSVISTISNPYVMMPNAVPRMVGFTIDGSSPPKIRFFVDGYLNAEQTLANDLIPSVAALYIGNYYRTNWGSYWKGDIGDVQIYNKTLTELEIRSLYEDRPISEIEAIIE